MSDDKNDNQWILDPKSSITPSTAGALITTISVPLADAFHVSVKLTALPLSFLVGVLVTFSIQGLMSKSLRSLYCILNSLIIFSISVGIGVSVDSPPQQNQPSKEVQAIINKLGNASQSIGYDLIGIKSAKAQDHGDSEVSPTLGNSTKPNSSTDVLGETQNHANQQQSEENESSLTQHEISTLKQFMKSQEEYDREVQRYNRRWSW